MNMWCQCHGSGLSILHAHCSDFFFGLYSDRFCYQENISNATADKVKAGMLEGVEAALGLSKGSLKPLYARVQLW